MIVRFNAADRFTSALEQSRMRCRQHRTFSRKAQSTWTITTSAMILPVDKCVSIIPAPRTATFLACTCTEKRRPAGVVLLEDTRRGATWMFLAGWPENVESKQTIVGPYRLVSVLKICAECLKFISRSGQPSLLRVRQKHYGVM
jgi:hypothetical protein